VKSTVVSNTSLPMASVGGAASAALDDDNDDDPWLLLCVPASSCCCSAPCPAVGPPNAVAKSKPPPPPVDRLPVPAVALDVEPPAACSRSQHKGVRQFSKRQEMG
jgi:hypothetical protein